METTKVIKVCSESIEFDNGFELYSAHDSECDESHWLSFSDLSLQDFDGLEFNLGSDLFFTRIDGYGIALLPINGHPVRIAGYGSNNGYYSSNLSLVVKGKGFLKTYDISDCQGIS